jgi:membrane-bound lytic murein transglycosylase A
MILWLGSAPQGATGARDRMLTLRSMRPTVCTVRCVAAALVAALAACSTQPFHPGGTIVRGESRWVPVAWDALPGWNEDRLQQAWPALQRSCQRPTPEWVAYCGRALQAAPRDERQTREWLTRNLQPYRVETLQGSAQGLVTGYYEPLFDARRQAGDAYQVPIYAAPADLATRRPYWSRREIDTLPAAQAAVRGREIAYLADPLDALALHIQGSGRLRIVERDGNVRMARVSYAGSNEQPYRSVGRWLIDQGELPAAQASWPAIRDWARRNPARVTELVWSNPRYVFFREEPMTDPAVGPRGSQGVPLTPGRSIAVDPRYVPYGTPVWLATTEPLSSRPLRRLVIAQDTGSAIVGPVRADYFWGWEGNAAEQAGRMRQALQMWVLWPR